MHKRELYPQSIWDAEALMSEMQKLKINPKNAKKLWRNLAQTDCTDYTKINELSKKLITLLDQHFALTTSKLIKRTDAKDGSTTKLLIQLQDGKRVESVIMRYGEKEFDNFPEEKKSTDDITVPSTTGKKYRSNKRATLCVSSQVGCNMGCTFCATGTMTLLGNLTSGEILEQLYHASRIEKIRGVVFMGMGEPLDNYSAVLSSIKAMTDPGRFNLATSRISISTVGIVPRIHQLLNDAPQIGLALSLHAPTQVKRLQIVPTAKAYPIEKIMEATWAFIDNQKVGRHCMIEYVLIKDVNDSDETARELGELLEGRRCLLNVIAYNETDVPHDYKSPTREGKERFVGIVREYGVKTILRQTIGDDINSACGQLVISQENKSCDIQLQDLEDLYANSNSNTKIKLRKRKREQKSDMKLFSSKITTTRKAGSGMGMWFLIMVLVCLVCWKVWSKFF